VRDIAGPIDEGASFRFHHVIAVPDADLPGKDHKQLVFVAMDVERRCEILGRHKLHDGETPRGLVTRSLEEAPSTVEPQGLALISS